MAYKVGFDENNYLLKYLKFLQLNGNAKTFPYF
jgi:hypothetical protein